MKLRLKSVARFTRQMATYQESFVDIRRALDSLGRNCGDSRMASSLGRILERVIGGWSLYGAFAEEGDKYPQLFLRMTKVGEETGTLARVYHQLADYLDRQVALRSAFIARMLYPMFMIAVMILVHSVLNAVHGAIGKTGLSWPELERLFLRTLAIDAGIIAAIILSFFILRFLFWGRSVMDAVVLFIPGFGSPFRKQVVARFSFSMGLMASSAIPLPEAVSESGKATNNAYAAWKLSRASERLIKGEQLTPVLADTRLFPESFIYIVDAAEESGKLAESLQRAAENYTEEADISMKRLISGFAWLIYLGMMGVMAFYIVRLYAGYVGDLNRAMR